MHPQLMFEPTGLGPRELDCITGNQTVNKKH